MLPHILADEDWLTHVMMEYPMDGLRFYTSRKTCASRHRDSFTMICHLTEVMAVPIIRHLYDCTDACMRKWPSGKV